MDEKQFMPNKQNKKKRLKNTLQHATSGERKENNSIKGRKNTTLESKENTEKHEQPQCRRNKGHKQIIMQIARDNFLFNLQLWKSNWIEIKT